MSAKPRLINVGDGKWIDPNHITMIDDQRYAHGGFLNIILANGSSVHFNLIGPDDDFGNKRIEDALKALEISL